MSDEAHFYLTGTVNSKQNCCYWAALDSVAIQFFQKSATFKRVI